MARQVAGELLYGGPERLLPAVVKAKPEMCWRTQDITGVRATGYRAAAGNWSQPKRKKHVVAIKGARNSEFA